MRAPNPFGRRTHFRSINEGDSKTEQASGETFGGAFLLGDLPQRDVEPARAQDVARGNFPAAARRAPRASGPRPFEGKFACGSGHAEVGTVPCRAVAGDAPKPIAASERDPRLPSPGTVLTRLYKGRLLEVTVLADGFAYAGVRFRSLSALAKHVTGSHTNGFLFFGLVGKEGKKA